MVDSQVTLSPRVDSYIKERLEQYASWYDLKAVLMKRNYMLSRITAAVGSVLIPILNNLSLTVQLSSAVSIDIPKISVTIIGVAVALLLALEGVLHHKEQWQNYRTTEQFLQAQKYLFLNRVGEYADLDDENAFKQLVTRVESAIKNENEVTLNVLTRSEDASIKKSGLELAP